METNGQSKQADPTINVRELINDAVQRVDDLAKVKDVQYQLQFSAAKEAVGVALISSDTKYQIQFNAAKESIGVALIAQEKQTAQALEGTKEAIIKNDANTDKRFDLLSEKIDGVMETISKTTGERGIYVTHSDLQIFGDKIQSSFENALEPLVSQVGVLTAAQNSQQGQSKGLNMGWIWLIGAVGLLGAIISIFFAVSK